MKKVAIIGCGGIAQVHAWSINQLEQVRLIACADPKIERAEQLSRKFTAGQAVVYPDLKSLLAGSRPDVVHICTPHSLHVPLAIEALNQGCHVFMEKPAAINREEFRALYEAGAHSGQKMGFCFQNRYNEATKVLDRIAGEKELGSLLGARAFVTWRRDEAYYSDDWHGRLDTEGGGVLINQSIHTLDLLLRYLGHPTNIEASMSNHHLKGSIEVEDTLEAWMEFEGGRRACFYASTGYATDAPVILDLSFEKGHASMMGQTITVIEPGKEPRVISCDTAPGKGKAYWGNGHLTCIQDFYSHLEQDTPFQNDITGIQNTMETTLRIYEKARKKS